MLKTIGIVLKDRQYETKFLLLFVAILIIAAFLMNFISFFGLLQGKIIFIETFVLANFFFLLVFSFLVSLALTLHVYKFEKFKDQKIGKSSVGLAGGFIGLFTSACSICYPLILTLIGIPTALAILPFGGIEFYVASIFLLVLSLYFISKSIKDCEKCKVN